MRELGLSETLAAVLVRRGYARPWTRRAHSSPAELPEHDPFALGDMRAACECDSRAVAGGRRICVHGDYDADGICATALAVLVLRELGADVDVAPAEPLRGGLRGRRRDAHAARRRGLRARPDRRLRRDRGRARSRMRVSCGLEVVVTDHHRPGGAARTARSSGPSAASTRSASSAGPGWSGSSARRCSAPTRRRSRGTSTSSRSRRSPTSCRSWTRTAASRSRGCAQLARTQKPGLRELMRSARVDPGGGRRRGDRLPARAAAERRRAARPARGRARAAADRGRGRRPTQLAGQLEELNRDRQAVEERILREAVEAIESWPEARAAGAPTSSPAPTGTRA